MKNPEDQEETRHLKKSKKKKFQVVWEFVGDKSKLSSLTARFAEHNFIQSYETEKAAKQALESWLSGRGNMKHIASIGPWKATVKEK